MDDIFTVLNAFPQTKMWVDDGWPVKHDMIVLTQFKPSAIGHCLVGFYMVSNSSVTWVAHPRYRPSHGFWGAFALHISKFAVTEATGSEQLDSMVLAFCRHSWHCSPPQPLQMLSMQDDTHAEIVVWSSRHSWHCSPQPRCFRCNRSRFQRNWWPTAQEESAGHGSRLKHRGCGMLRGYQSYQEAKILEPKMDKNESCLCYNHSPSRNAGHLMCH
jgi:hypothetical protein